MITSPWNSTVLRQYKTGGIISELAVAKAMGGLVADGASVVLVTPIAEKVPAFMLPITSEEYGSRKLNENGVVYVDGRSFMRREQRNASGFVVANQTQADFTVRLGELTALWVKDHSLRDDFLRVGDLAPKLTLHGSVDSSQTRWVLILKYRERFRSLRDFSTSITSMVQTLHFQNVERKPPLSYFSDGLVHQFN